MTSDGPSSVPSPATPGTSPARRRIWLTAAVVAWAALLVGLTYVSVGRDEPTVREQRSIADAMPVVHRALGDLVVAAGTDVVVELSPADLAEGCRITPFNDGATLKQAVHFRTTEAGGSVLLDRIAQRLPAGYRASARRGKDGAVHSLWADAGEFVGIKGGVTSPGLVTLTASTGCRPTGDVAVADLLLGLPIDEEPARVLRALGVTAVEPGERTSAACPGKGAIRTAWALGRGTPPGDLGDLLRPLAGAGAVVVADRPDLYAYRSGPLSVVVQTADGEIRVAATSDC